MFIGVVENQHLPLFPMTDLIVHPNGDLIARLRYDEPEMEPEHTVIGAAMRLQVLAGLEDREHGGLETGDLSHRLPAPWAERGIVLRRLAEADQEKSLPACVAGD